MINMKKTKTANWGLFIILMTLTACTTSVKSDAEKFAEMQCKSYQLLEKAGKGEISVPESTSFAAEIEVFDKEMKEKYSSAEDKKKFDDACLEAIAKGCK
jgi:hypothetical protein